MRKLLGVMVITITLVACGGGGSSGTKTANTKSAETQTADTGKDQATADAALLRAAELPEGFTEQTSSSSSSSDSSDDSSASQQFDACLTGAVGLTASQLDEGRTAKAKTRFKGSGESVEAEVELYADASTVTKGLDAFRNDGAIDCLIAGIRASSAKDTTVTLDDIRALDRPAAPAAPDGGAAIALQLTLTKNGQQRTVIESTYLAAKGRAEVTLTVTSTASAEALFVDSAIQAMLNRLP